MEKKKLGRKKTLWSKKLGRIEKQTNIVQIKNTDKDNINIYYCYSCSVICISQSCVMFVIKNADFISKSCVVFDTKFVYCVLAKVV